jgi:GNAT superfamily N-acetyltransferase
VATEADLEPATQLLTDAFATDPVWGWAFPDRSDLADWWRFSIRSALRFPWVRVLGDFAAAAIWIPPGESELTAQEEAEVEPMIRDLAGSRAEQLLELLGRFESSHPEGPPHYYLSLLGTDPARRGNGYGMALLEQNLAAIDAEGMPAYLESSNPANDPRYERRGFRRVGGFNRPDEELTVATMWRDARKEIGSGRRT